MDEELFIIGSGTYGEVMFELATNCGFKPKYFFDDDIKKQGTLHMGIPVIGKLKIDEFNVSNKNFIVAIGDNKIRRQKMIELLSNNAKLPNLIHPSVEISKYAKIGDFGCYIHANTFIWTKVEIDSFSIVSPCVMLAHHSKLEKATFVSAGSNIGAGVQIKENVFVGIGATIMTGVEFVGINAIIGAGSVIINDVPDNAIIVGNPGRIIKYKKFSDEE